MLPDGVVGLELVRQHLRQRGRRGLRLGPGPLPRGAGSGAGEPAALPGPGVGVSAVRRWETL